MPSCDVSTISPDGWEPQRIGGALMALTSPPPLSGCPWGLDQPGPQHQFLLADLLLQGGEEVAPHADLVRFARPTHSWPIGEKDLEDLCQGGASWQDEWSEEVLRKMEVEWEDWEEGVSKSKSRGTGNLEGEDLEALLPQHPVEVHGLLHEFVDVFGEILDHKTVKKLVMMDLRLKLE